MTTLIEMLTIHPMCRVRRTRCRRRHFVLARRAEAQAQRRLSHDAGDEDEGRRQSEGDIDAGEARHAIEGLAAAREVARADQDNVNDDEEGQRADGRRSRRKPRQWKSGEGAHSQSDQRHDDESGCERDFMALQPGRQVRQGGGLYALRHGEDAEHISTDAHEGRVAEGHDAGIPAEGGKRQHCRDLQQHERRDVEAGIAEGEGNSQRKPAHPCDQQQGAGPCTGRNSGPGGHRVSKAAFESGA
jgi:hypothetical protein